MENEEINFTQKNAKEYRCDTCDYKCCNKFDFNRHLATRKHSDSVNGNLAEIKMRFFDFRQISIRTVSMEIWRKSKKRILTVNVAKNTNL